MHEASSVSPLSLRASINVSQDTGLGCFPFPRIQCFKISFTIFSGVECFLVISSTISPSMSFKRNIPKFSYSEPTSLVILIVSPVKVENLRSFGSDGCSPTTRNIVGELCVIIFRMYIQQQAHVF